MPKNREAKSDEFYKSIIRNQKAEIKRLKQQIRRLEKDLMLNVYEKEEIVEIDEIHRCSECAKGELRQIELVGRLFEVCNLCNYRKRLNVKRRKNVR